ncbi:hypothetical protein ACHQM5_025448 [Ranunculus cassubicifolius]
MASSATGNPSEGSGGFDVQTLLMKQSTAAAANMYPPSSSYPPPTFHPQFQPPNPNNISGARIMALLNTTSPPPPNPNPNPNIRTPPPPIITPSLSSSNINKKLPKGRQLSGQHIVYDLDVRFQGEMQPQLEVTPITKYVSDPALVVGRQIAVNSTYICYGLKLGAIRILNINTASRALLKGHNQRVTDMAFFREEVHLLASVSVDGRVFVWKILEGPDEEDKPQISGHKIIDIHILGVGAPAHPRICWHSHKQEYLVVGVGKYVLKIDMTKVRKDAADESIKCHIDKLLEGVQLIGKHDGEVTDLSMCQWMTTRLASASTDGTVKIWDDRKEAPLVVMRPHDGQPVYAAIFLTATDRPNHINLITAGPLNREVKVWASTSEDGWLLPSDAESWLCTQILDLKSSVESRVEDAFFNQVLALPRAGLVLLANAKRNAIYAVHVEYGPNPAATRMDYIAEFTVTMPILSLTGTSDCLPDGDHVVQVYCVQTQAIQQYALDLCQCLPPSTENTGLERSESGVYRDFTSPNPDGFGASEQVSASQPSDISLLSDAPKPSMLVSRSDSTLAQRYPTSGVSDFTSAPELPSSYVDPKQNPWTPATTEANNVRVASPLPLSPRVSGFSPSETLDLGVPTNGHGLEQPVFDYSVAGKTDSAHSNLRSIPSRGDSLKKDEMIAPQSDISVVSNPPLMFKHPTHLITPSEILSMAISSSENTQVNEAVNAESKVDSNDSESVNVEVKVVGETGSTNTADIDSQRGHQKEKAFSSQASSLSFATETFSELQKADHACVIEGFDQSRSAFEEELKDPTEDRPQKALESTSEATVPEPTTPASRGKKQNEKPLQVSDPSPPSSCPMNSTEFLKESTNDPGTSPREANFSEFMYVQESLNQMISMYKEMPKQMTTMITKEGKRLEASLTRNMEKTVKANNDAMWARFQEESAKRDKLQQERLQQISSYISNCVNKDLPPMLDRILKKELTSLGQSISRQVTPIMEKSISSCITESFQRGVGDKAVAQFEKSVTSKLEGTVARHIQTQFQTSGKQALQDSLRLNMETLVVPGFEMACKAMFDQIDTAFQKGMVEHTAAAQQQFDLSHSPMTHALRDALSSAASITQSLSGELADGQRKLIALAAAAGANSEALNHPSLVTHLSNRGGGGAAGGSHSDIAMPIPHVEPPLDPTKELSRLISERKFGEAFTAALQRSDVSIVSWLCAQVDLQGILGMSPPQLSQGVLLALLQQLACDIGNETSKKVAWMRDVAVAINPADPVIAVHVRPIFEQVYQILGHQCSLPATAPSDTSSIRLVMHVINSLLMSCK